MTYSPNRMWANFCDCHWSPSLILTRVIHSFSRSSTRPFAAILHQLSCPFSSVADLRNSRPPRPPPSSTFSTSGNTPSSPAHTRQSISSRSFKRSPRNSPRGSSCVPKSEGYRESSTSDFSKKSNAAPLAAKQMDVGWRQFALERKTGAWTANWLGKTASLSSLWV